MSMQTLLAFARVRFTLAAMILSVNIIMLWCRSKTWIYQAFSVLLTCFFDLGAPLLVCFLSGFTLSLPGNA